MSKDSRNAYLQQQSYETKNGSGFLQKPEVGYKMHDKIAL